MSNPIQARHSTDPESVYYACTHGISQNPLYMCCDSCGNIFCEIRATRKYFDDLKRIEEFHAKLDSIYDEKERKKFLRRKKSREILQIEEDLKLQEAVEKRSEELRRELAEQAKKPKMTPEEQAFETKVGLTIWAILIFLAWLTS